MKVEIKFDFSGEDSHWEKEQYETMMNAEKYKWALDEMWQVVFRPYWKHGYDDVELEQLTNKENITQEELSRVIELLGDRYLKVLQENDINLG